MAKPLRPITGQPLPTGYDGMIWDWIESGLIAAGLRASKLEAMIKKIGSPGGGDEDEAIKPFTVVKKDDTTLTVASGVITIALEYAVFVEEDIEDITETSYIYLDITYSEGEYNIDVDSATSKPTQSVSHLYIVLGKVTCEESVISDFEQYRDGDLDAAGRIF